MNLGAQEGDGATWGRGLDHWLQRVRRRPGFGGGSLRVELGGPGRVQPHGQGVGRGLSLSRSSGLGGGPEGND